MNKYILNLLFFTTSLNLCASTFDLENLRKQETLGPALIKAIKTGKIETITDLIKQGADVNYHESYRYTSTLEWATLQSQPHPFVKLLLKHGADPSVNSVIRLNTYTLATPLWLDVPNKALAALLIIAGANTSQQKHGNGEIIDIDSNDFHLGIELRKYITTKECDHAVMAAFNNVFTQYNNEYFDQINAGLIKTHGRDTVFTIELNLMLNNPIHFALDHFDTILKTYVDILKKENKHNEIPRWMFNYYIQLQASNTQ